MTEVHLLEITEIPDFDAAKVEKEWVLQAQKEWYLMGIEKPIPEWFVREYLTSKSRHTRFFYLEGNLYLADIQLIKRFYELKT